MAVGSRPWQGPREGGPRWIQTHLQGCDYVHVELCLKGTDSEDWLEELYLLEAPDEDSQLRRPPRPPALQPPRPAVRHLLQQQSQAIHSRAVGGREVISELAQQLQPELREGREAVG